MVSVMVPSALSVACTRSVTPAPDGAVNVAAKRSVLCRARWAGCQCLPLSNDTQACAPAIGAAWASGRCAAVMSNVCRPGAADPSSARPPTVYRSVSSGWTAHRRGGAPVNLGAQVQPRDSLVCAPGAEFQVHSVLVCDDSGKAVPVRDALSENV